MMPWRRWTRWFGIISLTDDRISDPVSPLIRYPTKFFKKISTITATDKIAAYHLVNADGKQRKPGVKEMKGDLKDGK